MVKFIRGLWGGEEFWSDKKLYRRSVEKIYDDVRRCNHKFVAVNYVYGRDNQKFLADLGHESVLIDPRPVVWYPPSFWRHKLEIWKRAAADFGEFLFLDWDIIQRQPVTKDVLDVLRTKGDLQACLYQFHRRQCVEWRPDNWRKVPHAAFVYCSNSAHVDGIIKAFDDHPHWTEQIAFAYYLDQVNGGWMGCDEWFRKHEPYCCVSVSSPLSAEQLATKVPIFSVK